MPDFTPFSSLAGGMLIGASASVLLLATGRIAGISSIVGGLLEPRRGETAWQAWFTTGLLAGGAFVALTDPSALAMELSRSTPSLVAAGLLVGFGTRLGSGCTSGHGVCGISRLSMRSVVATITFMATAGVTVFVVNRWLGGAL